MAIVYPSIENIKKLTVAPTDGEQHLLSWLMSNLPDDFEIFFNPFLDGDRPDFIIVKKNFGILVIEVKDWSLKKNYEIDFENKWYFCSGKKSKIKSPFAQAFNYKKNLYDIHLPLLGYHRVFNENFFNIVKCFVYFHHAEKSFFESMYYKPMSDIDHEIKKSDTNKVLKLEILKKKMRRDISLAVFQSNLKKLMKSACSMTKNPIFSDEIYNEIKRRLSPTDFFVNQSKKIFLTSDQIKLSKSMVGLHKIKGVAGCGKTTILAERAANALIRLNDDSIILILTYNLSLRNYIRDKVRSALRSKNIQKLYPKIFISSYHQFYLSQLNESGLEFSGSNFESLFKTDSFKGMDCERYPVILIDEIQDYEKEWIEIIKNNFLADGGEMVVFGDQTQNIYLRDISKRDVALLSGFGHWNKINISKRSATYLTEVFSKFQKNYLFSKYKDEECFDLIEPKQLSIDLKYDGSSLLYCKAGLFDALNFVKKNISDNSLNQNDTCILSSKIATLQKAEDFFKFSEKTTSSFETISEIKLIFEKYSKVEKVGKFVKIDLEVEGLRRHKKKHFEANSGLMKICTVHSFKGFECKNIIFFLSDNDSDELIYTAITRAINSLIIVDLGNSKFEDFFSSSQYGDNYLK